MASATFVLLPPDSFTDMDVALRDYRGCRNSNCHSPLHSPINLNNRKLWNQLRSCKAASRNLTAPIESNNSGLYRTDVPLENTPVNAIENTPVHLHYHEPLLEQ